MNYTIQQTESFAKWHGALRDLRARTAISRRIDVGAGYRVYFTVRGGIVLGTSD